MTRIYRLALLLAILMLSAASMANAVPQQINFQGRLMDGSGTPAPDGIHSVRFSLWTDSTSGLGTELWFESQMVTTSGGLFSSVLGRISSFFDIFTDYAQSGLYLETQATVGAITNTLSPRTPMIASPYSLTAGEVRGEVSSGAQRAKGIVKGVGGNDKSISTIDPAGIALAAIQEL